MGVRTGGRSWRFVPATSPTKGESLPSGRDPRVGPKDRVGVDRRPHRVRAKRSLQFAQQRALLARLRPRGGEIGRGLGKAAGEEPRHVEEQRRIGEELGHRVGDDIDLDRRPGADGGARGRLEEGRNLADQRAGLGDGRDLDALALDAELALGEDVHAALARALLDQDLARREGFRAEPPEELGDRGHGDAPPVMVWGEVSGGGWGCQRGLIVRWLMGDGDNFGNGCPEEGTASPA